MKFRRSIINYIIPAFFVLLFLIGGIQDLKVNKDSSLAMIIFGLIIFLYCLLDYFTSYLEISNGMVKGRVGLIKRHKLSTPITNINGCSVKSLLLFNKIKITSGLTVYEFKNMKNAKNIEKVIGEEQFKNNNINTDKIVNALNNFKQN